MAKQFTDTDEVLRMINLRLRKLEKSDSEKTEEIGRLNRIVNQKDKEIHSLEVELVSAKKELSDAQARIKELEGGDDGDDGSSDESGKPEKNSSNSSVPPSQESIAARELRRTKSLRNPSGDAKRRIARSQGKHFAVGHHIEHEAHYCKCCGRPLGGVGHRKIRTTQVIDLKFVVETCEHQYYEKVCE